MSLLTQCPACQTYYRVVPDQLRISDGWVKCGNCSDIFDASAHLIEIDTHTGHTDIETQVDVEPDRAAIAPQDGLSPPTVDLPEANATDVVLPQSSLPEKPFQTDQVEYLVPASTDIEEVSERPEPVWATQQAEADAEVDATPDALPQLEFPEDEPAFVPAPDAAIVEEPPAVRWDDAVPSTPEAAPLVPVGHASDESVTFLHEDPAPSVWQKPLVRAALLLLAFGLLVLLAVQWVYRERDTLAATHPEIKPALQTACAWLNCEVRPLRQIDALAIDSVTFNKADSDSYRLSFIVKNTSHLPLAYPAVELVLTDAEDQPAYRRVLSNTELGSRATELTAGADWAVTVGLRIDAPAVTQRVFGYRLLVFYP